MIGARHISRPAELIADPLPPPDPWPGTDAVRSPRIAFGRALAYGLLTLACIPVQLVLLGLRQGDLRFPRWYHRICCRLFGFRINVVGKVPRKGPVLFVSNHNSYLDIPILGALIAGRLVAKFEMAGRPGFGLLAQLPRTAFE